MTYTNVSFVFRCAIYDAQPGEKEVQFSETEAKNRVATLQEYIRSLDKNLMSWKESVDRAREEYYELNYYTTLQLLELRKELGTLTVTKHHTLKPRVLMLLQSISPNVTSFVVNDSLQAMEHSDPMESEERTETIPLSTLLDIPLEGEVVEPTNSSAIDKQSPQQAVPLLPSRFVLPMLTYEDLSESQQNIYTNCVQMYGHSDSHVLKAFEECGEKATVYDIERWCEDNEDCSPQEEEDSVDIAGREEEVLTVYNPQEDSESDEDTIETEFVPDPQRGKCESKVVASIPDFSVSYLRLALIN